MRWWWLLALACAGDDSERERGGARPSTVPVALLDAAFSLPNPDAPLSWRLDLVFDRPVAPTVVLTAPDHEVVLPFAAAADLHALPILGVAPDRAYTVHVEADGATWPLPSPLLTPGLPARFPIVDVLAHDPARVEPGVTLTDLKVPNSAVDYLVAFDHAGRVVWFWDCPGEWGDTRSIGDYRFLGLSGTDALIANVFGGIEQRWTESPGPGDTPVDWRAMHHEVVPLDDGGLLTLSATTVDVDRYPTSYERIAFAPATLDDPVIVELGPDGATRHALPMSAFLDTERIGFDSLDRLVGGKRDWTHTNAVVPTPDGAWIVSVRHQGALVKVWPDGTIAWILADHAGWREAWRPYLLAPVGDVVWPSHQHAPELQPDGTVVVFDNGRWRANPYDHAEPDDPATTTRVTAFRIGDGTVEEAWAIEPGLYSAALGDADVLPGTRNVLVHLGFLDAQEDGHHADLGWGRKAIRIQETHPDGPTTPVWDLRLRSDVDAEPEGWKAYRGERLPSLYPPGVLR